MPARSDRRRGAGSQQGSVSQAVPADVSLLDAPAAVSPQAKITMDSEDSQTLTHGISILKEIFPEHGEGETAPAKPPVIQQLLGSLPSPARAPLGSNAQLSNSMPFAPPAHAAMMPMAAPVLPPPPPSMPAPVCQAPQEHFEPPRVAALTLPEQAFTSYRERLRAGGRGAFQRAYDAGYVPKNMKQDWNSMQTAQGALSHQSEMQNGSAVQYGTAGDAHQMWSGAGQLQGNDYCGAPMQAPYQCMQQVPDVQPMQQPQMMMPDVSPMQQPQMMMPDVSPMQQPQMMMPDVPPMQQSQMMMPMLPPMAAQQPPMVQGDPSPMSQMQMPQMQPQLSLPQMAMSNVHTPTASGESTPTSWSMNGGSSPMEMDSVRRECMAIVMPQTSQFFPCDQSVLAAQLQASADSQCYED